MQRSTIAILGLGAVGSRLAYFLTKLGFSVVAFDKSKFLFDDSGIVTTNLAHNSGAEYCRRASKADERKNSNTSTHVRTAELCIDGGITNALIYGNSLRVSTGHISYQSNNPLQFLVSKETINPNNWSEYQGFSLENFESNSRYLRNFYQNRVHAVAAFRKWSFDEAANEFYGPPNLLGKQLNVLEGLDPDVIAAGVTDIGIPVNQAYEYALWHSALSQIEGRGFHSLFNQELNSLTKTACNRWLIETSDFQGEVDFVFLTGSYNNPLLRRKIEDARPGIPGVFYLNTMAYAKLTSSRDIQLQKLCNCGYFTLQQDYGGMGISLIPMTNEQDGYVAIYYPSMANCGSQLRKIRYNPRIDSEKSISAELQDWNDLIKDNLPDDLYERHSSSILEQAVKLYPFYKEANITVDRLVTRSVFNADTFYGPGDYRNIRVPSSGSPIVKERNIWELYGAKWTNATLTALVGVDIVLDFFGKSQLPKNSQGLGFGLNSIDIIACVDQLGLHLKDIKPSLEVAIEYSRRHGFPDAYVNPEHEIFK